MCHLRHPRTSLPLSPNASVMTKESDVFIEMFIQSAVGTISSTMNWLAADLSFMADRHTTVVDTDSSATVMTATVCIISTGDGVDYTTDTSNCPFSSPFLQKTIQA